MFKFLWVLFLAYLAVLVVTAMIGLIVVLFVGYLLVRLVLFLADTYRVERSRRHVRQRVVRAVRPRTEAEILRADVARIIRYRGEARFIRDLDERLGNPPDPRFEEE